MCFNNLRFHKEAGEELFRIAMHYDETWQYEQAVFWYRKAAELDHAAAQYHLGLCYAYGVGVEKQVDIAAVWYRKAAEQNHVSAQFALGMYYSEQTHLPEHYQAAVFWFEKPLHKVMQMLSSN